MQRRKFSRKFKVEAVRLARERDVSVAQASRDIDVHESVVRKWVKEFCADPKQAFPGHGQVKPSSWRSTGSGVRWQSSRRSATCLKKGRGLLRGGVDMKFGFIAKHRSVWPVTWLCEALGVSKSGLHAWLKLCPCARSREDDVIMPAVRTSLVASARTYGARRVWRDVLEAGFSCGLHKIERLMRAQALRARPRRRAFAARRRRTFGLGDRAERARSPVYGGAAQPQMGSRLYLYLDSRRLALRRRGDRFVFAFALSAGR